MDSSVNRVLIIQHYTGIGGSALASIDMARVINAIGYNAVVALPEVGSPLVKMLQKYEIEYIEDCPDVINFTYHNASSGIIKASIKHILKTRYKKKWKNILKIVAPDIVLLNSGAQNPMISIVREEGIPCICYVRETIRYRANNIFNIILRNRMAKAEAVLFLSKFDMRQWRIKNTKQYVIPEIVGSQFDGQNMEKKVSDPIIVLYLGGFNYEKGVQEIVKAFSFIKEKNIKLEILGDDGTFLYNYSNFYKRILYFKQIKVIKDSRKLITELNKKGIQINIRGVQNNVNKWYENADIVVFPVKKVHQARPVYEAGRYALPVIVPDYENFEGSVTDGENGLVYQKGNVRDLADKITRLAGDRRLREYLGGNNKIKTLKYHEEKVIRELMEKVILDLHEMGKTI